MADFDGIVIGAGVVGIAIARALAGRGKSILLLEGERHFGSWTSSRNSEVVHAGLYYPPGSLKEALCVRGRDMLYAFCAEQNVPHQRIGKLVLAHDRDQIVELEAILARAEHAGVRDIVMLDPKEIRPLEPELSCAAALLSPSTGIVDSHAFMLALLGQAEARDVQYVSGVTVDRITRTGDLWSAHVGDGESAMVTAPILINSAGLAAQALALRTEGLNRAHIPPLHLARGNYFAYSGTIPFSHLIYPVPEPGGLGTHLTLDLAGQARFGPDVEWIDAIDYSVDPARHARFAAAARRIWPRLNPDRLHPAYAGVRPKLSGPGEPAADFAILGPEAHCLSGLVALFGIESPGLTASLAIADHVLDLLFGDLRGDLRHGL